MAFKMARNLQDLQGSKILDNTKTQGFSIFLISVIFLLLFLTCVFFFDGTK